MEGSRESSSAPNSVLLYNFVAERRRGNKVPPPPPPMPLCRLLTSAHGTVFVHHDCRVALFLSLCIFPPLHPNPFSLSEPRSFSLNLSFFSFRYITEESKLFEYQTTSKFGIDSKTVLAYDIPPTADSEELSYTLEEFALDSKGIRKITANKTSVSFLIHFNSRQEAERALFQLNGSSFAGTNLHLHLYS